MFEKYDRAYEIKKIFSGGLCMENYKSYDTHPYNVNSLRLILQANFTSAVKELEDRGLYQSTKWLSELLCSLEAVLENILFVIPSEADPRNSEKSSFNENNYFHNCFDDSILLESYKAHLPESFSGCSYGTYYRIKSLIHTKDFEKVHSCLSVKGFSNSRLFKFLKLFSLFHAGERKSHAPIRDIEGIYALSVTVITKTGQLLEKKTTENPAYLDIWKELNPLYEKYIKKESVNLLEIFSEEIDPFCLYLLGVSAQRLGKNESAQEILLASLYGFPYNWSAWLELGKTVIDQSSYISLLGKIPKTIISIFFRIMMESDFRVLKPQQLSANINFVSELFPNSQIVQVQKALSLYHHNNYYEALKSFEKVFNEDLQLLDCADIYSHVMFLVHESSKLGHFAERCVKLDRLRPETCCVVGNFYACKGETEKALSYFCKATQLDSTFQSAWILMGHGFVEMKNLGSAIESYNQAISLNPKDCRAWNGLGSAYELLNMPSEAIFYYQKALTFRPGDPRLWDSLGEVYENIHKPMLAVKCYEHCLEDYLGATEVHLKLGEIHRKFASVKGFDNTEYLKAAYHYRKGIENIDLSLEFSIVVTKAYYFLAEFELFRKNYNEANFYCTQALNNSNYDQRLGHDIQKAIAKSKKAQKVDS